MIQPTMSEAKTVRLTSTEEDLCQRAVKGESGATLIDVITDQFVLSAHLTAEEAQGAGKVLKFMRLLREEKNRVETTKPKKDE